MTQSTLGISVMVCAHFAGSFLAAEQVAAPTDKVRRFAAFVIRRYDENGDGKLQRSEWFERMRGQPERIDLDADGIITQAEYQSFVQSHIARRRRVTQTVESAENRPAQPSGSQSTPTNTPEQPTAAESLEARRRSLKFYVDKNRLPNGVPQWFLLADRDGDAQLSLREFLASGRSVAEFRRIDRSKDGVLTAREVLAPAPAK